MMGSGVRVPASASVESPANAGLLCGPVVPRRRSEGRVATKVATPRFRSLFAAGVPATRGAVKPYDLDAAVGEPGWTGQARVGGRSFSKWTTSRQILIGIPVAMLAGYDIVRRLRDGHQRKRAKRLIGSTQTARWRMLIDRSAHPTPSPTLAFASKARRSKHPPTTRSPTTPRRHTTRRHLG